MHFHLASHRQRFDDVVGGGQEHPAPCADEDGSGHVPGEHEQRRDRDPDERGTYHRHERGDQRGDPEKDGAGHVAKRKSDRREDGLHHCGERGADERGARDVGEFLQELLGLGRLQG